MAVPIPSISSTTKQSNELEQTFQVGGQNLTFYPKASTASAPAGLNIATLGIAGLVLVALVWIWKKG